MAEKMSRLKAIRTFFESGENGRKLTMDELKALTPDDKKELGELAAAELGVELEIK